MASDRPPASSPEARRRMQHQKRRDTSPELAIRKILHRQGFRYRIDVAPLVGLRRRADIVFRRHKVAVFVDGCFWHRCPEHGTVPRANRQWWIDKLDANVVRDRATDDALRRESWTVVRIWEHEDPSKAAARIARALGD